MRLYIKKVNEKTMVVYKETLLQSLISDFVTIIVMLLLIGSDALFSIYIGRSFVIDLMVAVLFIGYMFGYIKEKKVKTTKEEIIKILQL